MLASLDEISNDSLKEEGFVLSHGSGSHHGHRAQLLWGLCVQAEHRGRSYLPHRGWAAVRGPLVK